VQVQLVVLFCARQIDPFAPGADDDRRWANELLEHKIGVARAGIAFNGEHKTGGDVLLAGVILVGEHREWRAEHDGLGAIGGAAGVVLGNVDQKW
jgi:hypothetical protein